MEYTFIGDGHRVKGTVNGATTTYIGNSFEWSGNASTMVKYYYAGAQRVDMRIGSSTWRVAKADGTAYSGLLYKAWGEQRSNPGVLPTTFRYTGQRQEPLLGGDNGLYYYGARWYDTIIGRFLQADTLIPDPYNTVDFDRYAYARNNPLGYIDPTGHDAEEILFNRNGKLPEPPEPPEPPLPISPETPEPLPIKNDEWAKDVEVVAIMLDNTAAFFNGVYAITGDLVTLTCPECYPLVLAGYRFYSYIPNSISTVSMGLWVGKGIITGENSFSVTQTPQETVVSLSVSQDSIAAITTNTAGWLIPEPHVATVLDSAVVAYDYGRSGLGDLIPPSAIPTWINPNLSYSTMNGFSFNWVR